MDEKMADELVELFDKYISEFIMEARDLGVDWDILQSIETELIGARYYMERLGEQ